ncbi:sigma-70 family RNA polymerase sigma factor [Paenibacillus glacialis]|uniref:RNA polymerase subunit sigma-70 n=1 Tax=Paenibacillus glacialis TaxID=494026 RepID=A0A168L1R3_9BACL|nr:sigma-70 family RNA polymerase sigma factor [Paenibacillus glacialis]OAB42779.1 hypothetical protein PGLA_09935 [Paenibacillus glacialis]
MEDAELIIRIQQGKHHFTNLLIERHYDSIGKYCYWRTSNIEAAQDITQETFYRFFRNFDQYTHVGKCRAYLYTIARHLCYDYFQARRLLSLEEPAEEQCGEAPSMEETVDSQIAVNQLIKELPTEQQEVLFLRFCYDLRFREIAEITGVNICIVQYRVKRGLSTLNKKLGGRDKYEETTDRTNSKHAKSSPYQSGADSIILSSRYGRNKVITAKLKASFIVSLGLLALALITYTLLLLGIYGFEGGGTSVQIIKLMAPVPYTVFQTYLWVVFIGSLACLLVGAVTLWLSSRMRSPFHVIITIGILLIGPLLIPASKSSRLFNHMMDLLPGNMFDSFTKVTGYEVFHIFGQLIPEYKVMAGFSIIVIALLLPLTYRSFKTHQVV